MKNNFKVLSISAKKSSLEARELVALDDNGCSELLGKIGSFSPVKEAIVLSTCNRTEIYYISERDESELIIKLIGMLKGRDLQGCLSQFEVINDSSRAIEHLFRVCAGLESQILGDMQIPHQVKKAYQLSADMGYSGTFMHRLLHSVFFTNKRIAQETGLRDGAASISYTASQLAKKLTQRTAQPKVMVMGLGEIGIDVCKNLQKNEGLDIYICNRTKKKSEKLAGETGFSIIDFNNAYDEMAHMDVVISSINREQPFITKTSLESCAVENVDFIDVSVPRSVASDVSDIPGVQLFNIDQLKCSVGEVLKARKTAIPKAESIIQESIAGLDEWLREMLASPTINKIKVALEQIRQEQLGRFMKKGGLDDRKIAEEVTKGMVQKILNLPVLQLKAACKRGEEAPLIETLNALFDLEKATNS